MSPDPNSPANTNRRDRAFVHMALDIIGEALGNADNPGKVAHHVAQELRRLTGARTVALLQGLQEFGGEGHNVAAVFPTRHAQLGESAELSRLAELTDGLRGPTLWPEKGEDAETGRILARLGYGQSIAAPLNVGAARVGCLLLLGIPEDERNITQVIEALDMLSRTVALVFRNSLLYERQEAIIGERTAELSATNTALRSEVAERMRTEDALRREEERARQYLDVAGVAIIALDAQGRVALVNQRGSAMLGYEQGELLGRNWFETCLPERLREDTREVFSQLMRGDGARVEQRENPVLTKEGEERVVAWTNAVFRDATGQIIGTLSSGEDITERKGLEDQLRQAQKMEAIGQLAGGVAHDFNNILQAIVGGVELASLEAEPESPICTELAQLMKAAERATTLVRQLLVLGRREEPHLEQLDLDQVIGNVAQMIRRVIGEHMELDVRSSRDLGSVRADRGQIEQLLVNLCVNARDAMPEGGKLVIESENVELDEEFCRGHAWAKPGRHALLSVADTGCGMDQETRERAFEPFFTTKESGSGTGLGLSTVYGIVRQHGGIIELHSSLGMGAKFKIYLPVSEAPLPGREVAAAEGPAGGSETILLAEDDEGVRRVAIRVLERAGYTVLSARDGEEAIRVFDARADEIDLALLDVVMPKLGGRAVFDHIRSQRAEARVLFASGYGLNAVKGGFALDEGMLRIQKPYHRDTLLRGVREALDT